MEHPPSPDSPGGPILEAVRRSLSQAAQYSWDIAMPDGHWYGELKCNVTITAEHIFVLHSMGKGHAIPHADEYEKHFFHEQQPDGSWSIAPGYPGDVSTSTEAYLALRLLGVPAEAPRMRRARAFIRAAGGVASVKALTRIWLAQFGLFPWDALPQLPAELILAPAGFPLSIYSLASWARSSIVPLLVIFHHRPVYPLPDALSSGPRGGDRLLDELWLDPRHKDVPLAPRGQDLLSQGLAALDTLLRWLGGPLRASPLRRHALARCVDWILARQEPGGDWAGIVPPMHLGVQALLLAGHAPADADEHGPVARGLRAIERFHWVDDEAGRRLQSCVSPVWDTALMLRGLCDAGLAGAGIGNGDGDAAGRAARWLAARQLRGPEGDWRVYTGNHRAEDGGGFSFEYANSWYPDVDDTAAVVLALLSERGDGERGDGEGVAVVDDDDETSTSEKKTTSPPPLLLPLDAETVTRAARWLCGMQNRDGGWAAFDVDCDRLWLNRLPFCDMDNVCDPSTPDVTGRLLELFGRMAALAAAGHGADAAVLAETAGRSARALAYLAGAQEADGSWFGRWACNYVFGTCNVLCGLASWSSAGGSTTTTTAWAGVLERSGLGEVDVAKMMARGVRWLKRAQNPDGGWGEALLSYKDTSLAGRGPSTPSQTSWALMGLIAASSCVGEDEAILAGIRYLLREQSDVRPQVEGKPAAASWPEAQYTGTGFPNHFYMGYTLYRHYFPLMALGRFAQKMKG